MAWQGAFQAKILSGGPVTIKVTWLDTFGDTVPPPNTGWEITGYSDPVWNVYRFHPFFPNNFMVPYTTDRSLIPYMVVGSNTNRNGWNVVVKPDFDPALTIPSTLSVESGNDIEPGFYHVDFKYYAYFLNTSFGERINALVEAVSINNTPLNWIYGMIYDIQPTEFELPTNGGEITFSGAVSGGGLDTDEIFLQDGTNPIGPPPPPTPLPSYAQYITIGSGIDRRITNSFTMSLNVLGQPANTILEIPVGPEYVVNAWIDASNYSQAHGGGTFQTYLGGMSPNDLLMDGGPTTITVTFKDSSGTGPTGPPNNDIGPQSSLSATVDPFGRPTFAGVPDIFLGSGIVATTFNAGKTYSTNEIFDNVTACSVVISTPTNSRRAIYSDGSGHIWQVAAAGSDGFGGWTDPLDTGLNGDWVTAVSADNLSSVVYATYQNGTGLKFAVSTDGGYSFNSLSEIAKKIDLTSSGPAAISVMGGLISVVYSDTNSAYIVSSVDGGYTWGSKVKIADNLIQLSTLAFLNMYVAGFDFTDLDTSGLRVFVSQNLGANWEELPQPPSIVKAPVALGVWPATGRLVLGLNYHSDDAGLTWQTN